MVLVSAPAGFGKTTLITSWLDQQPRPTVWLSLDKADNDPSRFFSYFFSALSKILPDTDFSYRENSNFSDFPTNEDVLISIIKQLEENPSDCIIVLDDYHLIKNPVIHDSIQFFIQNLAFYEGNGISGKKTILPILISRSDPPFSLSKWRLQGELTEIRMNDLRVSENDAKSFLHQATGLDISEKQAKDIVSQTEGWIAGLQMAAISFNEQRLNNLDEFIQGFNGGNHLVADYLLNEVISLLPEKLQQFLVYTSILERFSGSLCDEIIGTNDSQEVLESLERSNLFIIPLDDQRTWYRYHHLLSEYLSKRRVQMPKESFVEMHLKAASWFEAKKYWDECIQNYLAVGEIEEAVRIITQNASSILNLGKVYYMGELIAYFPEDAYDQWPWLCIYHGWKDVIIETGEEEYWVNKAEQAIEQNNRPPYVQPEEMDEMLGNIAAIRAMSAAKLGDIKTTLEIAPIALELLPKSTAKVRGLVLYSEGRCQYLNGQLTEAQETFFHARDELIAGGNISGASNPTLMAGEIAFIQGKLHMAENILKNPVSIAKSPNSNYNIPFQFYFGLGMIYYEWNLLNQAFDYLQKGYSGSKKFGISSVISTGVALANDYLNLREWKKAEAILDDLSSNSASLTVQPIIESIWTACWIRLFALTGRYRQAERLIEERNIQDFNDIKVYQEPELLVLLEYYQLTNKNDAILVITKPFIEKLQNGGRNYRLIQALLFQTKAFSAIGEKDKALLSLTQALSLGRLEGFIRSFVDAGEPVLKLLLELSHQNSLVGSSVTDSDYIHELVNASINDSSVQPNHLQAKQTKKGKRDTRAAVLDIPLTPPERSILQLLVAGYDNYEIASNQHISVNTVKTHISHIFNKLGVHNRVQASNRAKILDLV